MALSQDKIEKLAKEVIEKEASAIRKMADFIDYDFVKVVECIFHSNGRLIITGIGKSAIIANKIVATLNSTGTPSIFMHAADAIHGDLGIIQKEDIVLCLSKSGNTAEIKMLVPLINKMGNCLIALVANRDSFLSKHSNHVLYTPIDKEACPNNLAPTTSTTAQLVMGDALAICLLRLRGFTQQDFAKFHPGGSLGKKLYTRVSDIIDRSCVPMVDDNETIQNAIINISSNRLGATVVVDEDKRLVGIITDGDVRRMVERGIPMDSLKAKDIMSVNPKQIDSEELAINAFNLMEVNKITSVVVLEESRYIGLIHIHDIIREGIV